MTNNPLVEALRAMRDYGCPVCSGDCSAANPPVSFCPMQMIDTALASSAHAQAARLEGARVMQEAAEIAARDCMCDQEWPPQDGDVQIDEVRAAIRDLDPLSIAEKGV